MTRARRQRKRHAPRQTAPVQPPAPSRFLKWFRIIYFAMMAVALLCIVLTRGGEDLCLVIVLAATAFGIVVAFTSKKGFWD